MPDWESTASNNSGSDRQCPLCRSQETELFHHDSTREYVQCCVCRVVFVPPNYFLSTEDEKAVYDYHENDPSDKGYRSFLNRLAVPLLECLSPASHGLDFGAGPGPTLSVILQEAGHRVDIYDPFYAADRSVFERQYDFITATEVVEHLHRSGEELYRLWSLLKPGGVLALMTRHLRSHESFQSWHYKTDPTHVVFYCDDTWQWLADYWKSTVVRPHPDVVLFTKHAAAP